MLSELRSSERITAGENAVEALEVRLFLEAIYQRYDYDLRGYAPGSMQRRVLSALAKSGCSHMGELQHRVLEDSSVFQRVLEELTVQTSDLFRDPGFYAALRTHVLPVLRTYPLLRLWHAGCASGEEAYTSAIMLSEAGLYERAQIYATDLSARAVEQAKHGIYAASRAESFGRNYSESGGQGELSSFYTQGYQRIAMTDSLRRNLLFFQHNLVSDSEFGEMNVVFCRNVFIYFQPELRRRVLRKFACSLRPGGFLCLGSSEHLNTSMHREFEPFVEHEHIYRRTAA